MGDMATDTAIRAQLFHATWGHEAPARRGHYATRRLRTSVYATTDGLTRELLRPVRD